MSASETHVRSVKSLIQRLMPTKGRLIIAIAGPPGSGKSTLAEHVVSQLNQPGAKNGTAALVPMDGFHLDIEGLKPLGLVERRGAPETFDLPGLTQLLERIRCERGDLRFPLFDRAQETSLIDAGTLSADTGIVVVEGNYLLLNQPGWRSLGPLFDATVFLDVSLTTLEQRLMGRWLSLGFSEHHAREKVEGNDLLNAQLVLNNRLPADLNLAENA